MRVDIRVPVGRPVPEVAEFAARCEEAGFDGVGVHDHPHSGRDVYVTLGLAARRTRRLRVFPLTSSPVVRHPLLLASAAHSLQEIAPGRVALTVAPGFLAPRSIGRSPARVDAMREAILAVRRLLAGETAAYGGTASRMRHVAPGPTPVYLVAAGPRMTELAGETADGAMLMVGLDPRAVAAARRHLAAGAGRAGRSLDGFPVIFIVTIALAPTFAEARRWPQRWFAPGQPFLEYPSASNLHWLGEAGLPIAAGTPPEAIDDDLAARVADAMGLFGPPERCAERLRRAREEAQVEHVLLFPAHTLEGGYDMPVREVEAFRTVIRPRLA